MRTPYDEGHAVGASKAKCIATKRIRKLFKIGKSKIAGTSPNDRFESALEIASRKLEKLRRSAKLAKNANL